MISPAGPLSITKCTDTGKCCLLWILHVVDDRPTRRSSIMWHFAALPLWKSFNKVYPKACPHRVLSEPWNTAFCLLGAFNKFCMKETVVTLCRSIDTVIPPMIIIEWWWQPYLGSISRVRQMMPALQKAQYCTLKYKPEHIPADIPKGNS